MRCKWLHIMVGFSTALVLLLCVRARGPCGAVTSMACRCRPQLGLLGAFPASSDISAAALKAAPANTAEQAGDSFVAPERPWCLHCTEADWFESPATAVHHLPGCAQQRYQTELSVSNHQAYRKDGVAATRILWASVWRHLLPQAPVECFAESRGPQVCCC